MNKKNTPSPAPKINRALYVVTVALLFVVAVIIAVMGSGKKATKNPPAEDQPSVTTDDRVTTEKTPDTYRPKVEQDTPDTKKPVETKEKTPEESKAPVSLPAPDLMLPTSGILTKDHSTDVQVYSQTMGDYRTHCGIDISTALGEAVLAAADGKVIEIKNDPLYGITVAISHEGEMVTYYKNLDEDLSESVAVGSEIKCGQIIGVVGDSAMVEIAEEPHLHFEVSVSGKSVDPIEYLDESALVSLTTAENYES